MRVAGPSLCALLLLVCATAPRLQCAAATIDATLAAELSREIREYFRASGFNWISLRMLTKEIDLRRNAKPLMYVLTSRTCADCRNFMSTFTDIKDPVTLSALSSQFLAVLALDDYILELGPEFEPPNGDYLPRVIFADPDGTLRLDITNPRSDKANPYYYPNVFELMSVMRKVLQEQREAMGTDVFRGDLDYDM